MDNASRQMKKIGGQFKNVGTALTVGLTAPITALGIKSFNVFASFEDQLAKVKAISGATGDEFSLLKKNAEELGATTRFTASQVAELQLNLSKLGFNPTEILATTKAVTSLAIATGEDLGNSATVAASTLRGFQLDVSQTGRVVDVMAKSFSSSALDLEKFSVAMAILAPVANAAGVSIEDATAQLSVLVNSGIDASTAGTGLRNIFLDIAEKGITLEQALNKINSSSNQNVTALQLFGKRGATVATVLAKNISAANELANSYRDSAGAAEAMAKIMDDTAAGSMARLKSAFESFFIAIGEELAPVVRRFADAISEVVSKFQNLSPATKRLVVILGGLLAALGPLSIAFGFFISSILPALTTGFAVLTGPIGLVTAAVAGLVYVIASNWDEIIAYLKDTRDYFKGLYDDVELVRFGVNLLVASLSGLFEAFKSTFGKLITVFGVAIKNFFEQVKVVGALVKATLSGDFKAIQIIGAEGARKMVASLAEIKDALLNGDGGELSNGGFVGKASDRAKGKLKELESAVAQTVVKTSEGVAQIREDLASIGSAFASAFQFESLEGSGALIESYVTKIDEAAIKAQYVAKVFQEQIGPAIQDAAANIASGMGGILAGIATGTAGVADIGNLMLATMGDLMIRLGKIAIKTATGILAIRKSFESLNPAIALAAGVALIAFGSIIKSKVQDTPNQVALANGGVVFGETLSLVGDNRNAVFDPEVVSPLSKLKDFIDPGRGAEEITVNVIGDVKGDDIKLIVDRVTRKQLRRG